MPENKSSIGLSWAPSIPSFANKVKGKSEQMQSAPENPVLMPESKLLDGLFVPPGNPRKLNALIRKGRKDTAGKSWFDMPAATITPEVKKDLEILKLRGLFDPKKFYKRIDSKSKGVPKYFQMGTVIGSSTHFYTERLTKKERKETFADELLSDQSLKAYRKRKVQEIENSYRSAGHEKWKIKGTQMKRRSKPKRAIL